MMGHGGSQHKRVANIAAAAESNAQRFGYATVAIDGPGHGDQVRREEAAARRAASMDASRRSTRRRKHRAAFGSEEKTLHMNPGGHTGIPPRERGDWATFWRRHLSA